MEYTCLTQQTFTNGNYKLVPIRQQDLLIIKDWRNAQMDILRQNEPLTAENQKNYFQQVLLPAFAETTPRQILFSYLLDGKCIGYGGIVHIDWFSKRGEVSFLVDPARSLDPKLYERDFTVFLTMIKEIAFTYLSFHRLFTETFNIRPQHMAILESQNFFFEGKLRDHVRIDGKYVDSIMHGCLTEKR